MIFSPQIFVLGVVIFGGLGFLNIWDFPWYVVVFAGAHLLRKANRQGWNGDRLLEFVVLVLAFGASGVLAYLPFYLSFSSQAGGILPNVINPTRGIHQWIMFGTLFLPLFSFLIYLAARRKKPEVCAARPGAGSCLGCFCCCALAGDDNCAGSADRWGWRRRGTSIFAALRR